METIRTLYERTQRPILLRIIKQFGDREITEELPIETMSNSQVFFELSRGFGNGKPHSLKNYVRKGYKLKNS